MTRRIRFAVIFLPLFLSACVGQRTSMIPDELAWSELRESLQLEDDWTLRGRISLKKADDGYSGSLNWVQAGDAVDLSFRGPLGIGGFEISGDPGLLTIQTSNGEHFVVTDPVVDLEAGFGWSLPVHSMRYWVLGVPDPDDDYQARLAENGQALNFDQSGWQLSFRSYRDYDGQTLPRKMEMKHNDLRIRLVVDEWSFR